MLEVHMFSQRGAFLHSCCAVSCRDSPLWNKQNASIYIYVLPHTSCSDAKIRIIMQGHKCVSDFLLPLQSKGKKRYVASSISSICNAYGLLNLFGVILSGLLTWCRIHKKRFLTLCQKCAGSNVSYNVCKVVCRCLKPLR